MDQNNGQERERVAIFLPSLRGGGAERVMTSLANRFAARGLAVDLVLARAEGPYLSEVADDVRVVDLGAARVLFSLPGLVRYLRRSRPRAMLSALSHANVVAILARRLAATPTRLVVSERGLPGSADAVPVKSALTYRAVRALYPQVDHVVSVSRDLSDILVGDFGVSSAKLSTIPNPIDIEAIEDLEEDQPDHPCFQAECRRIIAVGRLEVVKGYDVLLRSISLIDRRKNVRLLVLGEGSRRTELQELARNLEIEDIVDFVGFQANPFGWLARSDVYVLSSRSDAMPNSMLQALACGVSIVSTDCLGGAAEILEDGRWGRLVPVDDAPAMAEAIQQALADPDPPDVRERARFFDMGKISDDYLRTFGLGLP